jgi:hypothetical protein
LPRNPTYTGRTRGGAVGNIQICYLGNGAGEIDEEYLLIVDHNFGSLYNVIGHLLPRLPLGDSQLERDILQRPLDVPDFLITRRNRATQGRINRPEILTTAFQKSQLEIACNSSFARIRDTLGQRLSKFQRDRCTITFYKLMSYREAL